MPIPDVNIRNVEVRDVRIPSWMTNQPRIPGAPPVTVEVGVPVIDIPGCVEAHIENKKGTNDNLLVMTQRVLEFFVMVTCHHTIRWIIIQTNWI